MKRLVLLFVFLLGCLQAEAQKLTPKFLEGTWETEFHIVKFEGETKKDFNIKVVTKETGEEIKVLRYVFNKNNLYLETYYEPTNFKAVGKIILIDENTMVEDVVSEYSGLLIYKRITNN